MLSGYLLALLIFAAGMGGSLALSPHTLLPLRVRAKLLHGSNPPIRSHKWNSPSTWQLIVLYTPQVEGVLPTGWGVGGPVF